MIDIKIRKEKPEDINFITHSWLKNTKLGIDPDIDSESYWVEYRQFIVDNLKTSKILIACTDDDPDFIVGFIVYDDDVVHYCYVRYSVRRQGIAKKLLQESKSKNFIITHKPLWWFKNTEHKEIIKYNPFPFFKKIAKVESVNV